MNPENYTTAAQIITLADQLRELLGPDIHEQILQLNHVPATADEFVAMNQIPGTRTAKEIEQLHRSAERLALAALMSAAWTLILTAERITGHQEKRCTGRTGTDAYCLCKLGKDLRAVERRTPNVNAES